MFRFTDLIIFRMTRDCNLNCKYCFMQNKGDYPGELIDFNLFRKIIDRIIEQRIINGRGNSNLELVLHGGEVLLLGKKRLYEILNYATSAFTVNNVKFSLSCQTNATLLTEEIARILSEFNVNVGLSFDGIEGANSSRTNLKQEIFENKFQMLRDTKTRFGFLIVASKTNIDNMQKTQEFLETLGIEENAKEGVVRSYKINYAEDMINPGPDSEIEVTGQEMFDKVWKPELERFLTRGKTIEYHTGSLLAGSLIDILSDHNFQTPSGCGTKWCGAGIGMIAVEPDGEMDYCDRYSKKFDDVYMMHALDYDFLGLHQLTRALEYNVMKKALYEKQGCDNCCADYICDHGCESFYRSKMGEYGIDTRIICDQHIEFYRFVENHIIEILKVYAKNATPIATSDYIYQLKDALIEKAKLSGITLNLSEDHNQIIVAITKPSDQIILTPSQVPVVEIPLKVLSSSSKIDFNLTLGRTGPKHPKVFMNRSFDPEETYRLQKEWIESRLEYDLEIRSYAGSFWTSTMQIKGQKKQQTMYSTTRGKGTAKFECLASNYGELIERYSYEEWIKNNPSDKIVELKSLMDGKIYNMTAREVTNFKGTEAAGNNMEEARYHALCEVLELGLNNNVFRIVPVEMGIIKTESMFPEVPQNVHDSVVVFFQKDPRISAYDISVVRAPKENEMLFNSLVDVDYNKNTIIIPERNWNMENPNCTIDKAHPWPSLLGRRIGLSIEKTVKIAIAEMLQMLGGDDSIFLNNAPKKKVSFMKYYNAEDLPSFETATLEDDNDLMLNGLRNAGYNVWELNLTINDRFPVVKMINDYSLGMMHPCSRQFMSKFFEI